MKYDFAAIEKKWQKRWEETKPYAAVTGDKRPKFYGLIEFPYPSGQGLHVGHPRPFTAMDIVTRKKRMEGYNVLFPIGFDAFGLPTENYAIKNHIHPAIVTKQNIANFTSQLKMLGYGFDWDRVVDTTDPNYYKWTQWIFLQMFKKGLAYKTTMPVNWCTSCKCVLANEEVVNGVCERCGSEVIRKEKSQWMLKITAYAQRLLDDLEDVDFIERVKIQQRNWIGRSTGAEITFDTNVGDQVTVYTTRADTLFGTTYMVISPEHPLLKEWQPKIKNWDAVAAYQEEAAHKSDFERGELNKEKTGVRLEGIEAVHPVTGKHIPIFVSDYVLMGYGTGIVMGVPGHDQRDWDFATAFGLPIVEVVKGGDVTKCAFALKDDTGIMVNSDFLNGLTVKEAIPTMKKWVTEHGIGHPKTNFKLRDWVFSRQRYWGEPVPVVHTEDGGIHVLDDDELPLILPELEDYKGKNGKAPLENATEWKKYDHNGIKGTRETSTMPGSAGSSWYYFRYIDPDNDKEFANQELLKHWMPVDLYVGGPEHAVGHLMYSRIWNRFLYDQGLSPVKEPFKKLVHQGMILGENGIKMGKRYPEFVINPSDIVRDYGADTLRLYEMFMGPLEVSKPWSSAGVEGAKRFIVRVWNFFTEPANLTDDNDGALTKIYHQTVKKVTDDFEALAFNTAISQLMIFMNAAYKAGKCPKEYAEGIIKMMSCITPHVCEEMWQKLGHNDTIAYEPWPVYDENELVVDTIEIAVQINGKVRGKINVGVDEDQDSAIAKAKANPDVAAAIEGKNIVKEIYVKGRIVNIVAK